MRSSRTTSGPGELDNQVKKNSLWARGPEAESLATAEDHLGVAPSS
jgi:hypothetical protein